MPQKSTDVTREPKNIGPASAGETEGCSERKESVDVDAPPDAQASLELESLALSVLEDTHSSPEGKVVLVARFTKIEDKRKESFCLL
jgi:hypothetical protein